MTETTDIKALRNEAYGISRLFEAEQFIEKVIVMLEAERQQREAAEAELAALRGAQEPVAWTDAEELRDVEKHGWGYLFKIDPANPYTDPRRQTMVYRRQPKPVVVLPKSHYVAGCADKFMSEREVQEAMQAAGIVVKDGEKTTKQARTNVIGSYENSSGGLSYIATLAEHKGVGMCLVCEGKHHPGLPCPSLKVISGIENDDGE